MLEIAEKIVEHQSGKFDPSRFVDRYEEALREVIERKMKGRPIKVAPAEVGETNVVNLMEALKRSLGNTGKAPLEKRPRAPSKASPKPAANRRRKVA